MSLFDNFVSIAKMTPMPLVQAAALALEMMDKLVQQYQNGEISQQQFQDGMNKLAKENPNLADEINTTYANTVNNTAPTS
jgi:hypothetical protein